MLKIKNFNLSTHTTPFLSTIERTWRAWFGIYEIETSLTLKWSFGAILFFFFLTFSSWISNSLVSIGTAAYGSAVCWPYFQNCTGLYFLQSLPYGYSQGAFYMGIYAVMGGIVFLMWKERWVWAHLLMTVLLLWKLFVMFVLSYLIAGPYDYFHVTFAIILLFLPLKEYFLKLAVVVLYFLSGTTKFDGTWILGTYFTTLQTGLPLFPDALTPLITNLVIFMQVVGTWFLLSKRALLRYLTLAFFILFHLYSGILVNYHYPSVSLPLLIILFGIFHRWQRPPLTRAAIAGWVLIALLFLFQLPPLLIEGDRRLTLEGNRYGMFMFEANHECVATIRAYIKPEIAYTAPQPFETSACSGQTCLTSRRIYKEEGQTVQEERYETGAAWNRCDPYEYFTKIKQRCYKYSSVSRIALTFDHSINGGPFYRLVDEQNVCDLEYKPFSHNEWIRLPPEAPVVGYPLKDNYRY